MANEHMRNHQPSDPRLNLGNGSFMLPPNNVVVWGSNSAAYHNSGPRAHLAPLPNYNSVGPSFITDFAGVGSFMHPPSTSDSFRPPLYPMQQIPCYSQVDFGNLRETNNPQADHERAAYKRKVPAISDFNRGNSNAYYGAGSSSNPTSTEHFQTKPIIGSQFWPHDHASMGHNYMTNNLSAFEDESQRNVRSRHTSALLEPLQPAGHSTMPQDPHSVANTPGSVSFDLHSVIDSSGAVSSSHTTPYVYSGGVGIGYPNFIYGTTLAPWPAYNGIYTGVRMTDHGGYGQRAAFRTNVGYPAIRAATGLEDMRMPRLESALPPIYSRPPSTVGLSCDRNTMPMPMPIRNIYSSSEDGRHPRWASGSLIMTGQYNFRNLLDQHQDMRLNIDSMGYEELLALEERIGSVGTGLSQDAISKCLTESTYCSSQHIQEEQEEKCVICLEAYQENEQVVRLKCRHDFHSSCIRQWLLIKNVCPICKSSASEDS